MIIIIIGLCIILGSAAFEATTARHSIEHLQDYKYDDLNIEYHIPSNIIDGETVTRKGIWVKDPATGSVVYQLWSDISNNTLYYSQGQYKYGDSIFVPTYEESVYLSKPILEAYTSFPASSPKSTGLRPPPLGSHPNFGSNVIDPMIQM
jgi:hypothetical protein